LATGSAYLEQLYTFGDAYRDPRMRVITVAYYALVGPDLITTIRAGSDAADARWLPVSKLAELALAFDHQHIVDCALERIRGKLDYSDIAFALVRDQFTISELRAVHEIIESQKLDPGNFRRRINRLLETGWIREASGKRPTSKRPAQLYCYVDDVGGSIEPVFDPPQRK
jgi:8-oxo-dGTP diphosphatase